MIAAAFALFSAPDLALTQIAVEVVTTLLMLMTLSALPRRCPPDERPARRWCDAAAAALGGAGSGALAYAMLRRGPAFAPISEYHLAQSLPGAGGANAVNTIILDFRGYDTWGEITVLAVAALVILALSESLRARPGLLRRRWPRASTHGATGSAPMMLVVASRLFLPLAALVSLHIFLRGHNLPGGGFVAGLILAIAIVAQMLGMGLGWGSARLRRAGRALIGLGLICAFLTGSAPLLGGKPFLTSGYEHLHLPVVGEIELTSAALFDLGVLLVVLGGVSLALSAIARLTRDAELGSAGDSDSERCR
jgi:multicomponent K+:H+ antiporter subunit A